jgi:class 3 adenylate cyclase
VIFFVIENLNVKLKSYHYSAAKIYEEQIERQNSEQLETLFSSIQLVAIVFTAIDQYEDLILTKTAKVYNQLSQDFELMEKQCRRFGGRWVKTMGGGALLVFSSALNAVYWATKVQRSFLLTQQSRYKHRIAINLGAG